MARAADPAQVARPSRNGDFGRVLQQARLLRDYLLRSDSKSNPKLIAAILPFEGDAAPPRDAPERKTLFEAFQAAYDEARTKTDAFTLAEVLAGRSPFREKSWRRWMGDMTILFAGILLTLVALTYSFWAGRANVVLDEIEQFLSYDQRGQILRLIEMEGFFETSVADVAQDSAEPLLIYNEVRDDLRAHFQRESELPTTLHRLNTRDDPFDILWTANVDRYCRQPDRSNSFICPARYHRASAPVGVAAMAAGLGDEGGSEDQGGEETASATEDGAEEEAAEVEEESLILRALSDTRASEWRAAAQFAGRSDRVAGDAFMTRLSLQKQAEQLQSKVANVQNLWLPTVFGALGAIVYCMWRVLTPHAAPLGFLDTTMRVAFASLAGLTLSMLFVPANVLSLADQSNRPLIYLIAFVFGYSVEAFVATLNSMNKSLTQAMAPKTP